MYAAASAGLGKSTTLSDELLATASLLRELRNYGCIR